MKKLKKNNLEITDLIAGIFFAIISILLILGRDILYKNVIYLVAFILFLLSFFQLLKYLFRKLSVKESSKTFSSLIFNFFISIIIISLPALSIALLPIIFSLYLFAFGTAQFIMCFLMIENGGGDKIKNFIGGVVYYSISLPILYSPIGNLSRFLIFLALYTLFLSFNFLYDFFSNIISTNAKNKLKRRIRITLPKIFESIIPYSVMTTINKSLDVYDYSYKSYKTKDMEPNLFILIHTSNRGVNKFGHMDIYCGGNVISYGSYDEGSRKMFELFGDGVIFQTKNYADYVNFCIDNSEKTLFEFGIHLNNRQIDQIRKRIDKIFSNTYSWNYLDDLKYNNGTSYAAKLYKCTKAKFFKFSSGKYKTYFVLGTNCCYLADDIVGKSGSDILSLNGIITPGTYYDYLEKELYRKKGIVVTKNIYNSKRRCK